jgi:hypothetical protein
MPASLGDRLGLYQIVEQIGAGDMGIGNRSASGSTDMSPGARSMDLAHLVADVGC